MLYDDDDNDNWETNESVILVYQSLVNLKNIRYNRYMIIESLKKMKKKINEKCGKEKYLHYFRRRGYRLAKSAKWANNIKKCK